MEHDRVVDDFGLRLEPVAEASFDCQIDPGAAHQGKSAQTQTAIFQLLANAVDPQRVGVEQGAVFDLLG